MFFEQELQLFANVGFSPTEPVELFLEKRKRSLRNIVELTSQVLLHWSNSYRNVRYEPIKQSPPPVSDIQFKVLFSKLRFLCIIQMMYNSDLLMRKLRWLLS